MQQYAEQALETKLLQRRSLPTDILGQDIAAHNPIDPKKPEGIERVYSSSKEFGTQEWIQYKAPAGSVVVEDNSNGQILAMASYPRFDNRWMGNISGDKFDQLFGEKIDPATGKADPDKSVLVNRAVQGRYNLGSTIKPFVAWSAMHSGVIGPNEPYVDKGVYKLESIPDDVCASGVRCEFKNATNVRTQRSSSYGPVTVADALAVSSDAFFYRLGEKFWMIDEHNASIDPSLKGKSTLKDDLQRFGFGLRERRATAVRMARPHPRRRHQGAARQGRRARRQRGASLAGRRQRAGGHRSGPDGGDAAAAGQRVLDDRQRRLPLSRRRS